MNRRIIIALGALAIAAGPLTAMAAPNADPAALPAGTYVIDPHHAIVSGQVSHFGFSGYTFRFKTFDANFTYDPKAPAASKINVTIDATSLDTGYDKADKEFPAGFLGAEKNPKITFVSTGIKHSGAKGSVTGNLTLGGVTKPVTLDVTYNGFGATMGPPNRAGFSATGSFKRSDFGLNKFSPMIGDDVKVVIEAEFTKQ